MDQKLPQILLVFGLCIPSSYHQHFHYINLQMNWTDAQTYCREKYTDLATIESMKDINRLRRPALSTTTSWIGLKDDPNAWKGTLKNDTNSWKWSSTGPSTTGYAAWSPSQPDNWSGKENCVMMIDDGTWVDQNCAIPNNLVCYKVTAGKKTYVFSALLLTWFDALAFCRTYYTDLATIESADENMQVFTTKFSWVSVWIGLYRIAWTWSDNSNSLFTNWALGEPNNADGNELCVSESPNHQWNDEECQLNKTFICYKDVVVHTTVVKIKIHADTDLTDPTTNTQILQQLSTILTGQGPADIKVQWKIEPRKEENFTEPSPISFCPSDLDTE